MARKAKKPRPLTAKQRAFVEFYLQNRNATDAARRAGYSEKTAYSIGSENLRKPEIRAAIDERAKEFAATADEVLLRLASHSRGSIDDFLDNFGLIDFNQARQRGVLHLVRKVKQRTVRYTEKDKGDVEDHRIELELYDAQRATVELGKLLGLYTRGDLNAWREWCKENGINPDTVLNDLQQQFVAAMKASADAGES